MAHSPVGSKAQSCPSRQDRAPRTRGRRLLPHLGPVSPRSPRRCPNLASVTLSGCGHVTDDCLARLLRSCPRLRALRLENCARVTNRTLAAVAAHGRALQTLHVDFCRNLSAAGLLRLRAACPRLTLSAEHSAAMIPDQPPRARGCAAPVFPATPGARCPPSSSGSYGGHARD